MNRISRLIRLLVGASLWVWISAVSAQQYPSKPVRIIVPFPAGGIVDLIARAVADKLSETWQTPVLVEPKPGASSLIGTEAAAKAPADGYTLLMASTSHTVNPSLQKKVPYDPVKDFLGVVYVANAPNVVVVPASLPVNSLPEFVQYAKGKPGELNYAMPGTGSTNHLSAELLQSVTGIRLVGVGYKGQPPAIPDLLSGSINIMYATPPLVIPHVKTGRLKALAVASDTRLKALPDTPTLAEAGLGNTLVAPWFGLVARSGIPATIVQRINTDVNKALASADVIERLEKIYAVPAGGDPEGFNRFLHEQVARWSKLVKEAGITVQQ